MHTETRAEVLAALREIYDGAWTRHVGTDGGRTLAWKGKVGLLFAATGVIDSHYASSARWATASCCRGWRLSAADNSRAR